MKTLRTLYDEFPFKSLKKFVPIAIENGFTRKDAIKFMNGLTHDVKYTKQKETMLPIYSEKRHAYQFDTLIPSRSSDCSYFLIIINVNTRKLYAYPMNKKDTSAVLKALNKFVKQVKCVSCMTSDEDKAYVNPSVTSFMLQHQIDHQTTFKNDHHRLGIINRAIKTLRDMSGERDITTESMKRLVKAYNNSTHSSIHMKPNDMTEEKENEYIKMKQDETDAIGHSHDLAIGSVVRVMNDKSTMGKKRTNATNGFIVDSKQGNKYIIKAKDNSAALYPRYKLIQGSSNTKLEESIDDSKHAVIDKIVSFNGKGHYKVQYEGGEVDTIPVSYLREGRPTRLSLAEVKYWKNKSSLPVKFRSFLPK